MRKTMYLGGLILVFAVFFNPAMVNAETCKHYQRHYVYTNVDSQYHKSIEVCSTCGAETGDAVLEKHDFQNTKTYKTNDSDSHFVIYECKKCKAQEERGPSNHIFSPYGYKSYDGTNHITIYKCVACNEKKEVQEKHDTYYYGESSYEKADADHHYAFYDCLKCDGKVQVLCDHTYSISPTKIEKKDESEHWVLYECEDCGYIKKVSEKHVFSDYEEYKTKDNNSHLKIFKCKYCDARKTEDEEHWFDKLKGYEKKDDSSHYNIYSCPLCKGDYKTVDAHSFNDDDINYENQNGENHLCIVKCEECGYEKKYTEKHNFVDNDECEQKDGTSHIRIRRCIDCGAIAKTVEEHDFVYEKSQKNNKSNHNRLYKCNGCKYILKEKEEHDYSETGKYVKQDGEHHVEVLQCEECGEKTVGKPLKHSFSYDHCSKKASLKKKGELVYKCKKCKATKKKACKWKYNSDYSIKYDIASHSDVYLNSRKITVKLKKPLKGGVLKVKIGKKSFEKKIKNNKKSISVPIKNFPYAVKISIKLYYKGKLAGKYNQKSIVCYAKRVKVGMTKKQVRYTWGDPSNKGSSSGGWTYWYYDDGSWVDFKNGKVKAWYDGAG